MDDFLLPTIELLFRYLDGTGFPMVPVGERLLDAERRAHAAEVGRSRTRWLDEHHAERSFPCGVVRWEAPRDEGGVILEVFVTAVVTDTSVVFLVERPDGSGSGGIPVEVGSIDRGAITEVEVLHVDGRAVPRPAEEPMDPEPEVVLVIRWRDATGASAVQRLLFGSSWEAWRATDRLRAAMASPDGLPG
jgi:hypothetical protein